MADEIKTLTGFQVINEPLRYVGPTRTTATDQTTARIGSFTADIGTSEENIVFGDIVPGYVRFTNLDATNFVRLRFSTTDNAIRLLAVNGEALFYVDTGVTVIAIADTATCKIQVEAANV